MSHGRLGMHGRRPQDYEENVRTKAQVRDGLSGNKQSSSAAAAFDAS